jgi:hypothetical protein
MNLRHAAGFALLAFSVLTIVGCGAVMEYDRMQEENDRQALIRDYRQCVESHPADPSVCDHITSGLNAGSVTVHQGGN